MGTRFEFVAVHAQLQQAEESIDAAITEVERLERMISSWDTHSYTSMINANAGRKAIEVPEEMYRLIERSIKVSELTEGAFDISVGPLLDIYTFNGGSSFPPPELIRARKEVVNYNWIKLGEEEDKFYVLLEKPGMRIGFGAIGKGWAANKAKAVMESFGLSGGMVSASGDLICWGNPEESEKWSVAIADPQMKTEAIKWLEVGEASVVTSGDYEKFLMKDGKRYAHIIDPRTGFPVTGVRSVTIVSPDPEIGDALATAIFVMGLEKGLALVESLRGVEMIAYDADGKEWSSGWKE
jgi:thiamine biosynthesis lipoprotein